MTEEHKSTPVKLSIGEGLNITPHPFQVLLRMMADAADEVSNTHYPEVEFWGLRGMVTSRERTEWADFAAALRVKAGGGE